MQSDLILLCFCAFFIENMFAIVTNSQLNFFKKIYEMHNKLRHCVKGLYQHFQLVFSACLYLINKVILLQIKHAQCIHTLKCMTLYQL